ncbi:hypothetical protein HDZ31DRAFT_82257 [Schizophyllum fasciatum]
MWLQNYGLATPVDLGGYFGQPDVAYAPPYPAAPPAAPMDRRMHQLESPPAPPYYATAIVTRPPPLPSPAAPRPHPIDTRKWRDTTAPSVEDAPYLRAPGSDQPSPEDLRGALFLPKYSPPPYHWRAHIPSEPVPDADDSYTPPIGRLPVEMLSCIFTRCVDFEADNLYHANYRTSVFISHVCSLWRNVSIGLPYLWQHFSLRPCQGRGHYRMARLFIERSQGFGLYVHYNEEQRRGEYPVERCPCALDLILWNIHRLEALELHEISGSTIQRLSTVPRGAATSLVHFDITTRSRDILPEATRCLSFFLESTHMREIQWDLPFFPEGVLWVDIVVLSLTKCLIDTQTFLRILATAPHLRSVGCQLIGASLREDSLTRFHANMFIESDGPQDTLFQALYLPRLRDFSLRPLMSLPVDEPCGPGWPFVDINGQLYRFMLAYGGSTFDESTLVSIVELPCMRELKILSIARIGGTLGDLFFAKLEPRTGMHRSGPLLPYLEDAALSECSTRDGSLSRLLLARHRGQFPLRSMSIGYTSRDRSAHLTDQSTFSMLRQEGWMIDWFEA